MSDAVIVALITVGANLVVTLASAAVQSKSVLEKIRAESELSDAKLDAKLEKFTAVTDQKIEELTREVRKHNNFAERIPVLEEKISVANHRIGDLEKK